MKIKNSSKDEEVWKEIEGFEGQYAVSNKGRVRNTKTGRILSGAYDQHGYKQVKLNGKKCMTHRLVALAFIPNPQNLPQVDHIDEKKDNNDVSNLRWVTASQNQRHSAHQKSCQVKQFDKNGNLIRIWNSLRQIEKELGYFKQDISNACKGKLRYSHGYRWEYVNPSSQRVYNRPIAALTKDGELVAEYKSTAEASICLKIKYICIYLCLNGTIKSTHGLKFKYID